MDRRCRIACTPRQARYAAPAHCTTVTISAGRSARAPAPDATAATCTHRPSSFPATVYRAAVRPSVSARLIVNSTPGPGIAASTAAKAAPAPGRPGTWRGHPVDHDDHQVRCGSPHRRTRRSRGATAPRAWRQRGCWSRFPLVPLPESGSGPGPAAVLAHHGRPCSSGGSGRVPGTAEARAAARVSSGAEMGLMTAMATQQPPKAGSSSPPRPHART
jgi:hypothetical protein